MINYFSMIIEFRNSIVYTLQQFISINTMEINLAHFQENLSKRDKKDLYCRPLTALITAHSHSRTATATAEEVFNVSFLTKRKDSQGYTTRFQSNDKKAYRNIRSASLYQSLDPHLQDPRCKLQIINNACLKKIFLNKNPPFSKGNCIYNFNQSLNGQIEHDLAKKQNLPKYQCKKLKAVKGKFRLSRGLAEASKEEQNRGKPLGVSILGTKLL